MDFDSFFAQATGGTPYPYQRQLASTGLPELLRAPTGSGKTAAAVLPWLWRRRAHPDPEVRDSTPRWLIIALPMRTLVDQIHHVVDAWLDALDLRSHVGLHVLMGGRKAEAGAWKNTPARDAILVGSIDMLLSRALNRGYASNRFGWPIDFGMVNNGTQWVFDEVQLFGPALTTSRQLQVLRDTLGTSLPTRSMWMSATVDDDWLTTVDAPDVAHAIEIDGSDRTTSPLAERLSATRTVGRLDVSDASDASEVARAILKVHRLGTRTLVFVNTVTRSQQLAQVLNRETDVPTALVHSRFRPRDRQVALDSATADPGEDGMIVVSTQALEAGVDVSSSTLVTEVAPWSSITQRAGRCNRYGETEKARLLWMQAPKSLPYDEEDLARTEEALTKLEGRSLTSEELAGHAIDEHRPTHAVLRRKDLVELFDTTPDLSGDDLDIGMYIRDDVDRDVFVGWRYVGDRPTDDTHLDQHELCPVPIGEARSLAGKQPLWRHDHLSGRWTRVKRDELHPGVVLLADVSAGSYSDRVGWDSRTRGPVTPVETVTPDSDVADEEATDADPLSTIGHWVTLVDHLDDTARETESLLEEFGHDVASPHGQAAVEAARLHDIGKAHPEFQRFLRSSAGADEEPSEAVIWAKSSHVRRARHERRHFRHELISALALMTGEGKPLIDGLDDPGLVTYLVGAHHGRVRLGIRSLEREEPDAEGRYVALGVIDGESFGPVSLPGGRTLAPTRLPLAQAAAFGGDGSWTRLALTLRDRPDLGPFRLGFLEAVVRLSDWAASASPSTIRRSDGMEIPR